MHLKIFPFPTLKFWFYFKNYTECYFQNQFSNNQLPYQYTEVLRSMKIFWPLIVPFFEQMVRLLALNLHTLTLTYKSLYYWSLCWLLNSLLLFHSSKYACLHVRLMSLKTEIFFQYLLNGRIIAPAGTAQRTECRPANQRDPESIPNQSTCLTCGPGPPQQGAGKRQPHIGTSLPLFLLTLPSKNK